MNGMLIGSIEVDESTSENLLKVFYGYDSKSRLSSVIYGNKYTASSNTYDFQHEYTYTYNDLGQISSLVISQFTYTAPTNYSHYMRVDVQYDNIDRVSSKSTKITNSANTSTSFTYKTSYEYKDSGNAASHLVSKYTYQINSGTVTTFNYVYDSANINITQISDASGTVQYQYTYDVLGRLIREDNRPANRTYVYTYDTNGNILTKVTYDFTLTSVTSTTTKHSTNTYTYGNSSWKDQLTSFNGTALTYDAMGNPTTYYNGTNKMTFTWVRGRELATAVNGSNSISYAYGASGMRISKTVNGVVHTYIYDGSLLISEEFSGKQLIFLYDENDSPLGFKYRESTWATNKFDTYIYAKNIQGDVVAIYNDAGTLVTQYVYDAWGNIISTSGTLASTIGTINPIRYRGYYYDTETSFYYLQSRYYDPAIGRFINADNIYNLGEDGELTGYNLYAYCANNPVMYVDPTGDASVLQIIFGLVVATAAAALTIASFYAAMPYAVCASTYLMSYVGISATFAEAVTVIGITSVATASALYSMDAAYSTVTGESPLLTNVFNGNMQAYETGAYIVGFLSYSVFTLAYTGETMGVCFVAGTLVKAEEGNIPIETVTEGMLVYATNPETGETELKQVVRTFENEAYELVHVFVGDDEIICTNEHPFYSPVLGWVSACHLRAGDILVTVNGEYVVVEKVQHELLESPVKVYNFEVEDFHTYYVGSGDGVLVHNDCETKRGVGGKGWVGDKTWKENVKTVGKGGTIKSLNGGVPNRYQAIQLINESGGSVIRIEGPHNPPNPHNFPHINYITKNGIKGTIQIV